MTHLIVDTREKATKKTLSLYPKKIEFKQLITGDYGCNYGCCLAERKEDDFSEQGFRKLLQQLHEMRSFSGAKNVYLVVNQNLDKWLSEGNYPIRKGLIASLLSRNFTPLFIKDHLRMIDILYETFKKNHDSKLRGDGEFLATRRVSHKDKAYHILMSLPGIGKIHAEEILKNFGSVNNFLRASEKEIMSIKGIGKKITEDILNVLCKEVKI